MTAHRASWMLHKGPIENGLHVLHRCDVPNCVNPEHLFLGTHQDNMFDAKIKCLYQQGENHYRAKLDANKVRDIRRLHQAGVRLYILAKQFNVDRMTIKAILVGATWKGVK